MKFAYFSAALLTQQASAGKCPFGYDKPKEELAQTKQDGEILDHYKWPGELFTCPVESVPTTKSLTKEQYQNIAQTVIDQYEALPEGYSDNTNTRGSYAGCLVRLVGHDIMDFNRDKNVGGADGCIDLQDGDNLGLAHCIQRFNF